MARVTMYDEGAGSASGTADPERRVCVDGDGGAFPFGLCVPCGVWVGRQPAAHLGRSSCLPTGVGFKEFKFWVACGESLHESGGLW